MRILLLGGTDLTLRVAQLIERMDMVLAGVLHVGSRFAISYAPAGVRNVRAVDLPAWCTEHGVPHQAYEGSAAALTFARDVRAEFGLAAGWYHMVAADLRQQLPRGCAGLHASLLPKLRGGAPLNWAILTEAETTGITLFELGEGVDDGPIYAQRAVPLKGRTTIGVLVQTIEAAAVDLLQDALPAIATGSLQPRPQVGTPTYCLQRTPEDGRIDWSMAAPDIDRLVRAVGRPYPGAFTALGSQRVHIWETAPVDPGVVVYGVPGQLARIPGVGDCCVVTGHGVLQIVDATDAAGDSLMPLLRGAANQRFETR